MGQLDDGLSRLRARREDDPRIGFAKERRIQPGVEPFRERQRARNAEAPSQRRLSQCDREPPFGDIVRRRDKPGFNGLEAHFLDLSLPLEVELRQWAFHKAMQGREVTTAPKRPWIAGEL